MEEEMSTYSSIIESEVCNMGFEMDLGFFSNLFPLQGSLQWCCTAVFCTLSVTKLGTPDIHLSDFPSHAVDFSPSHFPEERVRRQNGNASSGTEPRWLLLHLEQPMLSLSVMWAEGRDACVVSHLIFDSITSAAVWTNLCESWRKIVGCFCQEPRGSQHGTNELLARLEGRSSLKNLEPYLFAEEGSPVHGKNVFIPLIEKCPCKSILRAM